MTEYSGKSFSSFFDRRVFLTGVGSIGVISVLAGCGRSSSLAASDGGSAKKLIIGSIVPTLDATFWQSYVLFMESCATDLGIEIVTVNANNSADGLSRGIDDLVARKVDGLIFVPYFGSGPQGIATADSAGIPSMCVDTTPENIKPGGEFTNYIGFVGPDDEASGYNMAEALSQTMAPGADGTRKIVAIQGTPGTSVAINRYKGLQRYIAEKGDLTLQGEAVGNFVATDSQKAMDDLLQRHPDTEGVWCANGGTAAGAVASIANSGKQAGKDIKVVTMDLNPDNLDRMEAGEIEFDTGGHWLMGGFALIRMFDWINEVKIPDELRSQTIKLLPVTKATLPQFGIDYPDGQLNYDVKQHSRFLTPDGPATVIDLEYSKPVSLDLRP